MILISKKCTSRNIAVQICEGLDGLIVLRNYNVRVCTVTLLLGKDIISDVNLFSGGSFDFGHHDSLFPDDMFEGFAETSFHYEGHSSSNLLFVGP